MRQVVRTAAGKIELIVAYNKWFGWFGWFTRPVAVPIEVVGIEGRQLASLDMPDSEYATAPTWQNQDATALLGRRDDPNRVGPQLIDHEFVKRDNFSVFPDLYRVRRK